jgi:hypothetical protein
MKKLCKAGSAVWVFFLCLFISGCVGPLQGARRASRFHEASSVNAVLQFSSWDYIFLVRPNCRDDGFLRPLKRNDLATTLDQMNVPRGTVVVMVGWMYSPEDLNRVVAEWKSVLKDCGFQRIVVVRANAGYKLNGSLIIDDSIAPSVSAKQTARL